MKKSIVGITAGLICALVFAIWQDSSEAVTGILSVLSVTVYKAYRVINEEKESR